MRMASLKGFWNRSGGYSKLTGSTTQRRKTSRLGLTETPTAPPSSHRTMRTRKRSRLSWRLNRTRRLNLSKLSYVYSPKKFLGGLRDAYINFMNKFADIKVIADGIGGGYGGANDDGFAARTMKEYDEQMIIKMYKSIIISQGQMVQHRDAPRIAA